MQKDFLPNFCRNFRQKFCRNTFLVDHYANHIISPKLWHHTFPPNCGKNVMTMWRDKKFSITISSHFYHNLTKKILWSSLALKDSYSTILFNKWSQSEKNVMKMWWLEISTYFLVHIIWKFPPLQNLMSDARCLDVDACLSAPNLYSSNQVWVMKYTQLLSMLLHFTLL